MALRSKLMGLAAASHFIVNVAVRQRIRKEKELSHANRRTQITEAGPSAFATISQNYYYVSIFLCLR